MWVVATPHIELIASVLDAVGFPKAVVAFICVNALVGHAFANRYPERVIHLFLSQAASLPEMKKFGRRIDLRVAGVPLIATPFLGQVAMRLARKKIARLWFKGSISPSHG